MLRRGRCCLCVGCSQRCMLHGVQVILLKVRDSRHCEIEIFGPLSFQPTAMSVVMRQRRVKRRNYSVWRRARSAKVRWSGMTHVSCARMSAHVARICEDRKRMMGLGIMLGQAMMGLVSGRLVQAWQAGMLERRSVVVRFIGVRSLALLGRMRLL